MFSRFGPLGQWLCLLAATVVATVLFRTVDLPGALLLGPMAAGILLAVNGARPTVPRLAYNLAQSVVGTMIAAAVTPDILRTFATEWPVSLSVILASIVASGVTGWVLCRWQVLPGTAAIWGISPGAASAMVLMAEEFGADVRIVAFMQYLRVLCVALTAALLARFCAGGDAPAAARDWLSVHDPVALAETLALVVGGLALGRVLRVPSGALLLPLAVGSALRGLGLIDLELPQSLLSAAFAAIGWVVGLRFTGKILKQVAMKLPHMLASILALMAFCTAIAWVLTQYLGIDMLTAYLATSPGGADSIAIIAASTNVDLGFVMAFQTARLILVIVIAPIMARRIAKAMGHGPENPASG
jgi:membrane AbrB-like protein